MGRSELLIAVVLILALIGCNTTKVSDKAPATQLTPEVRPATKALSNPTTPQSIVKELFPGAPEKTESIECFRSITSDMSMYRVAQKCGRPDEDVGSGVYVFVYHLRDGFTARVSMSDLNRVDHVSFTDAKGVDFTIVGLN